MPRRAPFEIGRCACRESVRPDAFRTCASRLAFSVHGRCQPCQDATHLHVCRAALGVRHVPPGGVPEVAFIPFLFARSGQFLAWEASAICRLPPAARVLDAWDELGAMSQALKAHRVRVHDARSIRDPLFAACLGALELLIGIDAVQVGALASSTSVVRPALCVALAEEIAWRNLFGIPLCPLEHFAFDARFERWILDPRTEHSALRTCAWLGAALGLSLPGADPPETVMARVLRQHASRFEETS